MIGSLQLAAALLLGAAGVGKVRSPAPAAALLHRAVRVLRRRPVLLVRAGGIAEIAVAAAVIGLGGRWWAIVLAGCYLGFLVVAALIMSRGERASCGCFGAADSPVGTAHLLVNIGCIVIAVAAAARPPGRLGGLLDGGPLLAVAGLAQSALLAYLLFLSITAQPALAAARRKVLETR